MPLSSLLFFFEKLLKQIKSPIFGKEPTILNEFFVKTKQVESMMNNFQFIHNVENKIVNFYTLILFFVYSSYHRKIKI